MQSNILFEIESAQESEATANLKSTLSIKVPGIIKNNEVLKNLFELVGESLLEIESISTEIENLQINNFTHFDVIKNSVKNTLLESIQYKNLKKDIINSANKIIDKTSHYHSHAENQANVSKLVKRNTINKNETNEILYTENKNTEFKDE